MFVVGIFLLVCARTRAGEEAYQPDFRVYDLGEIVISEETPAAEGVAITDVITAEEITATNSRTVAEALNYVPGIDVTVTRKAEPEVSIHGFDQSCTLILIDGVPYYETNYGKLNLNQIPTDIVSKIVITKGAPSVLYGANKLAGVINIITKKPSERPSASANLEVGEKRYNRESISHGMKIGIFNYWFNYLHRERDGWRMSDDFKPRMGKIIRKPGGTTEAIIEDGGFRDNSDFKSDSLWAKMGIEPNPGSEYYLNFHLVDSEFGMPPSIDETKIFTTRPCFSQFSRFKRYDDWGVDLTGKQKIIDQLTLKANLFYHNHRDDYVSYDDQYFTTPIATSTYKDYFVGGSFFTDYELLEWDTLRFAFHYRLDSHKDRDDTYLPFAQSRSTTGTIALEDEVNPLEDLSITAGLGYNWFAIEKAQENQTDKETGDFIDQVSLDTPPTKDVFDPMIGAVYALKDSTRLFASVARTTRFPTLQQLFSGRSGNPDLTAEKSINYTIGASRPIFDICRVELALFHHEVSDWISRNAPGPEGVYQNWAKAEMYGLEFTAEVNPLKNLTFKLGYTYNHARDTSPGRVTDHLTYVPENKVDALIRYIVPDLKTEINLTGVYVDSTYSQLPTPQSPDLETLETDDYFLMNVRITQPVVKYFEAYVAADNIFDLDYEPEYGFPGWGRTIYFGLTAKY